MIKEAGGDRLAASVRYYQRDIRGVRGQGPRRLLRTGRRGAQLGVLQGTRRRHRPTLTVMGEYSDDVFITARATKGPEEIERIKVVGRKTCEVVQSRRRLHDRRHKVERWQRSSRTTELL